MSLQVTSLALAKPVLQKQLPVQFQSQPARSDLQELLSCAGKARTDVFTAMWLPGRQHSLSGKKITMSPPGTEQLLLLTVNTLHKMPPDRNRKLCDITWPGDTPSLQQGQKGADSNATFFANARLVLWPRYAGVNTHPCQSDFTKGLQQWFRTWQIDLCPFTLVPSGQVLIQVI